MTILALYNFLTSLFKIVNFPSFALYGLTLACYVFLFIMSYTNGILAIFLRNSEIIIFIATILLSCLAFLKLLLALVTFYIAHRQSLENRKALTLISRNTPNCFWHLAKQPDGSFISQINIQVDIANMTTSSIGLSKVELIKPKKQKTIHAQILLPKAGVREYSSKHKIPAKDTVTASISIVTQGAIAPLGQILPTTIGITDQFGTLYLLKMDLTPTSDQV